MAYSWGEDSLTSQKSLVMVASISLQQSSREICRLTCYQPHPTASRGWIHQSSKSGEVLETSATVYHLLFSDPLAFISYSHLLSAYSEFGLISISGKTCKRNISRINHSLPCCNWFQICKWYSSSPSPTLIHSLYSYLELQMALVACLIRWHRLLCLRNLILWLPYPSRQWLLYLFIYKVRHESTKKYV